MDNDQETVLAGESFFDGKLEAKNVTLKGRFKGNLRASGTVRIVEGAEIEGTVEGARVEIAGKFNGDVKADLLKIDRAAHAAGSFRAKKLSVEEGGVVDGELEVGSSLASAETKRSENAS